MAILICIVTLNFAAEPVLVYMYDTTKYKAGNYSFISGKPTSDSEIYNSSGQEISDLVVLRRKDNVATFDVISITSNQVIQSFTVPDIEFPDTYIEKVYASQYIVDSDDEIEYIVIYGRIVRLITASWYFRLFDNDNTVLMKLEDNSKSFEVAFASKNGNGYLLFFNGMAVNKVYRFDNTTTLKRPENVLSKKAMEQNLQNQSTGSLQLKINPCKDGTTIQIFNMLGQLAFSKKINEITTPTTITIPVSSLPKSPFIARIKNSSGEIVNELLPVK
jgi:hypothetical protein